MSLWEPNIPYCDGDGDGAHHGNPDSCEIGCCPQQSPSGTYWGCGCDCGGGGGCFLADTKIATPGGEMNIQDVKVGDTVIGIDPETGERVETQVEDTHKTVVEEYYEVTVEKPDGTTEVLKVTGEHPLFVKRRSIIVGIISAITSKLANLFHFKQ